VPYASPAASSVGSGNRIPSWRLHDHATGESYDRSGDDLRDHLYVALDAWGWHLFTITPSDAED
jgi:hypothetical protein